jgi:large subunit ribosomal protein L21
MYAIIRAGGKQAKVREGDVLSVERIKDKDTVSFTPILVVADDGTVISDKDALKKASVTADILGESAGPKVDIFKYKAKTGYRRRQGHRQKYTTIKVTAIATGAAKKAAPKKAATKKSEVEDDTKKSAAEKDAPVKDAPKKAAPKKAASAKETPAKDAPKKAAVEKAAPTEAQAAGEAASDASSTEEE